MAEQSAQKRGNAKREALVQGAAELFWTRGFEGSSLADIAKAANIPVGNVYYYFKTKGDLAQAVADLFVRQTEMLIEDVCSTAADPRERLRLLVRRLQDSQQSRVRNGCPISTITREFRRSVPAPSARAAESFTLLTGFIAAELGKTGQRPALALGRARSAVADWQGSIALAHALNEPPVLAECFPRIERLLGVAGSSSENVRLPRRAAAAGPVRKGLRPGR